MKALIALFALPLSALAAEPPRSMEPGLYTYNGSYVVRQKRRAETVFLGSEAGRERMAELKKERYQCRTGERSFARCVKIVDRKGAELEIADLAERSFRDLTLEVGTLAGSPELVSEGVSIFEWAVPQPVTFRGETFNPVRYFINGQLHKLTFGRPAFDGAIVREDGAFGYVTDLARSEGRDVVVSYTVEGVLAR